MTKIDSLSLLSYSGYCVTCKTNHSLPSEKAIAHCYHLMQQLKDYGRIDFDVSDDKADERLSTNHLHKEIGGKMFGVLVCEDLQGNEVILKAFSSTHNGIWDVKGWAPHLVNEKKFMAIVEGGNFKIHPLTEAINDLSNDIDKLNLLILKRKIISQKIQSQLHALYELSNFKHKKRKLSELFLKKGIPNGTGDCCAPKLLNYAALKNLKPISIAEFYWGKTSKSGKRIAGNFYSACTEKCEPILGFMLCKAD